MTANRIKNKRCPVVTAATSLRPIPPAIFRNTRPVSIKAILLRIVGQVRRQILKVEDADMSGYSIIANGF
jgi:hypothetical protein